MMNVYFTVDTESSMAGAWQIPERRPLKSGQHIFCRVQGKDYGIGLITRVLGEYGFRATHFVETLAALVNGHEDSREVFDYLNEQNQDIQLHAHPSYLFYAQALRAREAGQSYTPPPNSDLLGGFNKGRQLELLEEAASLFRKFTGRRPDAFRAGCFSANHATLECLHKIGVRLDSSFNPCYREYSFPEADLQPNRLKTIEGVWEVPVTVARTPLPESRSGFKHADVCALSVAEMRTMLEAGAAQGQSHFVMLFHSFSAVKAADETYDRMKPNRIVIRRLEKLIQFLAANPARYRVSTFGELANELPSLREEPAPVAQLGVMASGIRKSVQALNRYYWI